MRPPACDPAADGVVRGGLVQARFQQQGTGVLAQGRDVAHPRLGLSSG